MALPRALGRSRGGAIALHAVLCLFFLQLLTVFIEAVYAFGLLQTSVPPEIASVLFLLAPFLLTARRRHLRGRDLFWLGLVILATRLAAPVLEGTSRMMVAGLGTGAFLVYLPGLLAYLQRERRASEAWLLGPGLVGAVGLSVAFRAWGAGLDLSLEGLGQIAGLVLAVLGGVLLVGAFADELSGEGRRRRRASGEAAERAPLGPWRGLALAVGLTGGLALVYFALMAPNVIARWMDRPLWAVVAGLGIALSGAAWLVMRPDEGPMPGRRTLLALNGLFISGLTFALLTQQPPFPASPEGYPFTPSPAGGIAIAGVILFLGLSPVLFLDIALMAAALARQDGSPRRWGSQFGAAAVVLLVLILAHVFTTVYDYIPIVGPVWRDRYWLVYLLAGLCLALPLWALPWPASALPAGRVSPSARRVAPGLALLLALVAVAGALRARPTPLASDGSPTLRLLTYNIQQGYDAAGRRNLVGQLDLMRELAPDVIGLQETDANRVAGGNTDLVGVLASALNMHAAYGPGPVAGTFGVALLSRYPLENPRTFYMYSEGEQTAALHAAITVAEQRYQLIVTHLGNGGPVVQQQAILREVAGLDNVILMGDFNFRADTEAYAQTTAVLQDAWSLRWPGGADDAGIRGDDRIDHVFLSPGMIVDTAEYILSPASDHPALLVALARDG